MGKDFTEGSIPQKLRQFAFPILLANLLQASMQLINGLWVGNLLGSTAFGAVTVATVVLMLVLAFVLGINNATLTIFAQLRSHNDPAALKAYLSTFVILLAALSVAIGVAGFLFTQPLLALLQTPDVIATDARTYLQINFVGSVFLVGYNFIGTVLRAFGDSRTPLYFVLIAVALTTVLAPTFIAGLGMGVAGAAYAIVAAQAIAFLYSLWYLGNRHGARSFHLQVPRIREIKTILSLGIPSGAQMIVIYAGMTTILSLVNTLGPDAVAGFGAAQRLDSLVLLPAVALGTAVTAMTAQNIGAGHWQRVTKISRTGVVYNLLIMLSLAGALFVWAEPLIRLFVQDEGSVAFGTSYLRTIAFFYPFIGLNFIFNGTVRGAGAMFQVLMLNIISLWILRVPLAYWATARYGDTGVALGIGISFFISFLVSYAYYRWGSWRDKQLFS